MHALVQEQHNSLGREIRIKIEDCRTREIPCKFVQDPAKCILFMQISLDVYITPPFLRMLDAALVDAHSILSDINLRTLQVPFGVVLLTLAKGR